ncbi:MAG: hypothetical protein Kow0099_17840 [Candidatus Abyssubacteria bacterium]
MDNGLSRQRCYNHSRREAVARCPECKRYYCRECVTEHEGRVVCAMCLAKLAEARQARKARLAALARAGEFVVALFALWLFFYLLGQALLALPSSFHEGTVWQVDYWER